MAANVIYITNKLYTQNLIHFILLNLLKAQHFKRITNFNHLYTAVLFVFFFKSCVKKIKTQILKELTSFAVINLVQIDRGALQLLNNQHTEVSPCGPYTKPALYYT